MADPTQTPNNHPNHEPLIPNLSNDVAIQCLARVPRFYHPHLNLVSKSWRSTLRSPLFHATRRALNTTESFLFINLRIFNPKDSTFSFKWYSLDPSRYSSNSQISNNPSFLIPIKSSPSHPIGASFVSLGRFLYVIGGSVNDIPSPNMWVFDSLGNDWELGPRMRVGREFAASGVIDGKIYVLGGCVVDNWARSMHWAEVFDPVSGVWAAVPSPIEVKEKWMHASGVVDGRMYAMADRGGVVFEPRVGEWGTVSTELDMGWRGRATVLDGVLYCYDYLGKIRGFDFGVNVWRELRGVEKSLPKFLCGATMAKVGGRLFVVWEGKGNGIGNANATGTGTGSGSGSGTAVEVRCAEILVKKDDSGGLWGSVVWSDVIIVIPKGSSVVHCLEVHFISKSISVNGKEVWELSTYEALLERAPIDTSGEFICWLAKNINGNELARFVALMAAVWMSRNSMVHDNTSRNAWEMARGMASWVEDYWLYNSSLVAVDSHSKIVMSLSSWQCPPVDVIKINVDAFVGEAGVLGFGAVLRNHLGSIMAVAVHRIEACWNAKTAEARAALFGLQIAWKLGYPKGGLLEGV